MQYVLMCCIDEALWEKLPEAEKAAVMDEYDGLMRSLGHAGRLRASVKLGPRSTGTTVRERAGETMLTDGPFAETKEQLGGFHLVECESLDRHRDRQAHPDAARGRLDRGACRRDGLYRGSGGYECWSSLIGRTSILPCRSPR
jgi:hypothetical protein